MEKRMASTESEVRALFDRQFEAIRSSDIERLMSLYVPEVLYFDVVPPLRFDGAAALRRRFSAWFDGFNGPPDVDIDDLRIVTSADLAVATWLSRVRGTLKNGRAVGSWVRVTSCCRRSNHDWLIVHEHVSWPVEAMSGRAAMDLVP
jgi:ketosteroid isomerase-like protein